MSTRLFFFLCFLAAAVFVASPVFAEDSPENTVINEIEQASSIDLGATLDGLSEKAAAATQEIWLLAKAYSIPLLVVSLLLAGIFLVLSVLFGRSLRQAAGGLVIAGIVAFILFNYAPQMAGFVLSLINSIFS